MRWLKSDGWWTCLWLTGQVTYNTVAGAVSKTFPCEENMQHTFHFFKNRLHTHWSFRTCAWFKPKTKSRKGSRHPAALGEHPLVSTGACLAAGDKERLERWTGSQFGHERTNKKNTKITRKTVWSWLEECHVLNKPPMKNLRPEEMKVSLASMKEKLFSCFSPGSWCFAAKTSN